MWGVRVLHIVKKVTALDITCRNYVTNLRKVTICVMVTKTADFHGISSLVIEILCSSRRPTPTKTPCETKLPGQ